MTDPAIHRHLRRLVLATWLTAVFLAAPVPAPLVAWAAEPPSPEAAAIGKVLDEFIDALNTADLARYTALFAQDATAFFPMAQLPLRLEDKAQIGIVFGRLFEGMRSKGSGPKFMNLVAQDIKVQILGDVALVSFHVKGSEMVSRRTLVLVKRGGRWLILHVHASNVQISQP